MAICVYIKPAKLSATQYENCMKNLDKAGASNPEGRLYHASFGTGDQMQVYEVWDSQESFNKFKSVLEPIVKSEGIDIGQPMVEQVYNTIQGGQHEARRAA